jgi:3',5'-cyclic AMP phosphodiesterase CpdA
LQYWPVRPGEEGKYGSWSINGNHDMYSGGQAYFDFLLADPRFARQEKSSNFSFENNQWQILGLDTAWEDKDLTGGQAKWVADSRRAKRQKKGMLLSHHQLFCAYSDDQNPNIRKRLDEQGVLAEGLVDSWFWGHEHLCALYEPRDNVRYARLVGHGGIPEWAKLGTPPPTVTYQFQEYLESGLEKFGRFGFAVLHFSTAGIHVQYVSELGQVHKNEMLT